MPIVIYVKVFSVPVWRKYTVIRWHARGHPKTKAKNKERYVIEVVYGCSVRDFIIYFDP